MSYRGTQTLLMAADVDHARRSSTMSTTNSPAGMMSLSASTDDLISLHSHESHHLDTSPMECSDASPSSTCMVPLSDLCLTSSSSPSTPVNYERGDDRSPPISSPSVSTVSSASMFGKTDIDQAMAAVTGNKKPLSFTVCTKSSALPLPSQFRCDMKMAVSTTDNKLLMNGCGSKAPMCKVCGDESSGFHYGVDSCEGCKGFFRRCITQGMTHKCSNSEKCEVTPFTRNTCQYCRLKKCFAVGMSREASRLGRRPKKLKEAGSELRSHNVAIAPYPSAGELYRLRMAELQRLLQQNGTFKAELMQAFISAQTSAEQNGTQFVPTSSGVNMGGQIGPGTIIVENGNPIMHGSESGYSSMSSPASSKSQSPIQVSSQMPNLFLSNGNNHPSNTEILMNANNMNSSMMMNMMPAMGGEGFDPSNFHIPDFIEAQIQMVSNSPLSENGNPVEMPASMLAPTSPTTPGIVIKQEMPFSSTCMMGSGVIVPGGSPSAGLPSGNNNNSINIMNPSEMMSSMMNATDLSNHNSQSHFVHHNQQRQQQDRQNLSTSTESTSSTATAIHSYKNGSNEHDNKLDIEKIQREVKQVPNESRRKLIEQVTESIVEAHMNTSRHTQEAVMEATSRIEKQNAPCMVKKLHDEKVEPSTMWSQFVSNMVPEITLVVRFCKKLPGFADIDQEDQICLIKQGAFECMLMRIMLLVDSKTYEIMDLDMKFKCSREVIQKMPMGQFFEEFYGIADCFNPLELTDSERGLYTAILIMCPDRPNLHNQRAVRKIQGLFLQALYFLLRINHAEYESHFHKLLNLLPVLRGINQQHSVALSNMKMMTPEKVDELPPLQREVFNVY